MTHPSDDRFPADPDAPPAARTGGAVGWPSAPAGAPADASVPAPHASPEPAPHGDPVVPHHGAPPAPPVEPGEEAPGADAAEDLEGELDDSGAGTWTEPEASGGELDGDVELGPVSPHETAPAEEPLDVPVEETDWSAADGDLDEHAEQPAPDEEPALAAVSEPVREPVREPVSEPVVAPVGEPAPPAGGRALLPALVGLVVVLALLTGFLWYQAVDSRGNGPVDAARREAVDAARGSARLVFSYDYRHLKEDFAAGRAVTTGEFRKEYDKTTSRLVDDVAKRYKAVVLADVSEASVVSASRDKVIALVFLNQQSSSTLSTTPKITQSRLEMTLVRSGKGWLVSRIKAL